MEDVLARHERIALQFSGGKDSLALLYLMRPFWDRLTVYWLDTGDAFPETAALVAEVEAMVPHFVTVHGIQPEVIAEFGLPSDLVPARSTPVGIAATGTGILIQDRYSCCLRSLMLPLHGRMRADGITLIIRGQKASDALQAPIRSGDLIDEGMEVLLPLEDWDDARVFDYLRAQGVAIPRFYQMMQASPDCMTCSAYWEEGRAKYLKQYHPGAYQEYQQRLNAISDATAEAIAHFNAEIGQ